MRIQNKSRVHFSALDIFQLVLTMYFHLILNAERVSYWLSIKTLLSYNATSGEDRSYHIGSTIKKAIFIQTRSTLNTFALKYLAN